MNLLRKVQKLLIDFSNFVIDVIFPRSISDDFINSLTVESLSFCQRAEKNTAYEAVFSYKDPVIRQIIWSLKFNSNQAAATLLAAILQDQILEDAIEQIIFSKENKILLIPIPTSKKRLDERGFNPTEAICKKLYENSNGIFEFDSNRLLKTRETERQAGLSKRKDREKNIANSFSARNVSGRTIIVIDDVFTSGATFKEARRALKFAGAKKVFCYAVAH